MGLDLLRPNFAVFDLTLLNLFFSYNKIWTEKHYQKLSLNDGAFRESNSGPLAPKARIIPLDQMPIW